MSSKPVKCVILGDCGVGKTSLVRKYISNEFGDHQSTLGASFWELSLDYTDTENKGHIIPIHIWDTAGQERYRGLTPMYIRNTDIALIVYDVNNKDSFNNLKEWFKILKASIKTEIPIFILGNKQDLEKVVTDEDIIVYTNSVDDYTSHYFVSAKTAYNVNKVFESIKYESRKIIKKKLKHRKNIAESVTFKITESTKKYNCCNLM